MGRPKGSLNKPKGIVEIAVQAVQAVQNGAAQERPVVVPSPSSNGERKYDYERNPLCFECGHRQDRHHEWREFKFFRTVRNYLNGRVDNIEIVDKVPNFDTQKKPCQHACNCWDYK